nr:plasmid segregation protein ParM domain-containing protein [Candidatus Arsenophonus triatominarum]
MKVFIDDGSTNIKLIWLENDEKKVAIVPTSFKRGWVADIGNDDIVNFLIEGEKYSFDKLDIRNITTNNSEWQYSLINTVAIHHALLQTSIIPQEVDITVTLPLAEYYDEDNQINFDNIERKKKNLRKIVSNNKNFPMFSFKEISVKPESIPAGFDKLIDIPETQSMLIVDIGGTTLDIAQISGNMSGVVNLAGDSDIGVSIITREIKRILETANTCASNYIADQFIINRHNKEWLKKNTNDPSKINTVVSAINQNIKRLSDRVIESVSLLVVIHMFL